MVNRSAPRPGAVLSWIDCPTGYGRRFDWQANPLTPSSIAPASDKPIVSIAVYLRAWRLLDERERLVWDLIMFMGLRKCEVFALQRKYIGFQTIKVEQGVYLGKIVGPKTYASKRLVGVIPEIGDRLNRYMQGLADESPDAWLFPSTTLQTPIDPNNLRTDYIKPKLKDANLHWISFQIIRRSHTTHNHKIGADPATMAKQQGHGIGVHTEVYFQPDPETLIRESSKLYAEFQAELAVSGADQHPAKSQTRDN